MKKSLLAGLVLISLGTNALADSLPPPNPALDYNQVVAPIVRSQHRTRGESKRTAGMIVLGYGLSMVLTTTVVAYCNTRYNLSAHDDDTFGVALASFGATEAAASAIVGSILLVSGRRELDGTGSDRVQRDAATVGFRF